MDSVISKTKIKKFFEGLEHEKQEKWFFYTLAMEEKGVIVIVLVKYDKILKNCTPLS